MKWCDWVYFVSQVILRCKLWFDSTLAKSNCWINCILSTLNRNTYAIIINAKFLHKILSQMVENYHSLSIFSLLRIRVQKTIETGLWPFPFHSVFKIRGFSKKDFFEKNARKRHFIKIKLFRKFYKRESLNDQRIFGAFSRKELFLVIIYFFCAFGCSAFYDDVARPMNLCSKICDYILIDQVF